jgi:hypothetical protein
MKTRSIAYSLGVLALAGSLLFTGCKKQKEFNNEDGQASSDNRTAQSEHDNAMNDVNDVISNQNLLKGKGVQTQGVQSIMGTSICGLSLDTAGINQGTIKLNYDGTVCNNRKREGSIRLTIQNYSSGMRWKNQGCILKVDYLSYKVTRASDGKSVKLDGTHYVKNETGGTWWELLIMQSQSSLATSVTGTNLNVTFEDGKTAIYNINRKITYTYPNSIITCTGEGIGSSDGLNNLENYGTTRNGDGFTSQVNTPIIWNLTCGWWAPIQGEVDVKVKTRDFTLRGTFGVDNGGNSVVVGSNQCPYGWKLEWTYKNKTNKKIFGYL